ncbi:hypothetical protein HK098_003256 [Nowakowskiella sp. JEL0407]|nr:hypothetical protein HK098_003256 [Nowakowskiella sp. JEL0407]
MVLQDNMLGKNKLPAAKPNDTTAKIPCKFLAVGHCNNGSKCPFSHQRDAVQEKSALVCMYYLKGNCRYGTACRLPHSKPKDLKQTTPPKRASLPISSPSIPTTPPTPATSTTGASSTTVTTPSITVLTLPPAHIVPANSSPQPPATILSTSQKSFNHLMVKPTTSALPPPLFTTGSPFDASPLALFNSPQLTSPQPTYFIKQFDNSFNLDDEDEEEEEVEDEDAAVPFFPSSLNELLTPKEQEDLSSSFEFGHRRGKSLTLSAASSSLKSFGNWGGISGVLVTGKDTNDRKSQNLSYGNDGWPVYEDDNGMFEMDSHVVKPSYANIAKSTAPTNGSVSPTIVSTSTVVAPKTVIKSEQVVMEELCPFATYGNCRYNDKCRYLHGLPCPFCKKNILHPHHEAQRQEHLESCEKEMEEKGSVDEEQDLECVVCMEKVKSKKDARFGLLSCEHCVCLTCIRQWRTNENMGTSKSCPICRKPTYFITPSSTFISNPAQKAALIQTYKQKLSQIDCKHFQFGEGVCPFGNSCFYRHVNRDGERVIERKVVGGTGEEERVGKVQLSEFLEWEERKRQNRRERANTNGEDSSNQYNSSGLLFAVIFIPIFIKFSHPPNSLPPSLYTSFFTTAGVSSENIICSQVGSNILKDGGSAVDAVIAASICIGVTNMYSSGLGGGGFLLVAGGNQEAKVVDFREEAPGAATRDMYKKNPDLGRVGGLSAGVPGEVRGFEVAHKKYGKLPWKRLFSESIRLCYEGWIVNRILESRIKAVGDLMLNDTAFREVFAPKGIPLKQGDRIKRVALGKTLESIANGGPEVFYSGWIAKSLVSTVQAHNGIITMADMKNYEAKVLDPIEGTYRGYKVLSTPVPSSGPLLISVLNILEGYDLNKDGRSTTNIHRMIEAYKYGFAQRSYFGDPVDAKTFDAKHYEPFFEIKENHGTMHVSIMDSTGLSASLTSTVNLLFGARLMDQKTGIILNDEMDDFSTPDIPNYFGLKPSPYNFIKPKKRPLSSSTPTIIFNSSDLIYPYLVIGASGGSRIPTSTIQTILNVIDYKLPTIDAVNDGRLHCQLIPEEIVIEDEVDRKLEAGLIEKGHKVSVLKKIWETKMIRVLRNFFKDFSHVKVCIFHWC